MMVTNLDHVLQAGLAGVASVLPVTAANAEILDTGIGELEFMQSFFDGYPAESSADKPGGLTANAAAPPTTCGRADSDVAPENTILFAVVPLL